MTYFVLAGCVLIVASTVSVCNVITCVMHGETTIGEQYTMMSELFAALTFTGAFVMFGIAAVLSAIGDLQRSLRTHT